jgi:hypothetical protein
MPDWKESAMITQFGSKRHAPLAYAGVNALAWIIYAALVLLATQVLRFDSPVAEAAFTLVAALALNPLRRRAADAARQRLCHR